MIASLPMYDRAETAGANDRLWSAIRDRLRAGGIEAPDALIHGAPDLWPHWTAPDLVLSQTCGFPYRSRLHGRVTLVGTPDYGLESCEPGHYRSVFVVRADDPRPSLAAFEGARLAWNDDLSQSGWAGPQTHLARLGIRVTPVLRTGGHKLSAIAVSEGRADIAALDAVTWRLIQAYDDFAARLRVVGRTDPSPGLPLISRAGMEPDVIFDAVEAAIVAMPAEDRQITGLKGLVRIPAESYLAVPTPPPPTL
ncbi:phosphate/phosphite/phosphonate ABC transporter substrate-binding protein [Tabrizicola sp. J26]|uniref:phosphate/phosphite/phosphonate ABC transporter substrate-binding protein n=1 Tax=Alitabrizicola rongguiensis TaxID=2909234 RepID=UPI001F18C0D0|nr:PhnD/SsuA/transferrin family substrate-binding protein [Tabrizicola rongguiensis]MCF1709057.1 phosphate/phosphite/phosphonate ABC transporter substrate-binding protein [Tabrizicola rongguiensis]